MVETLEGTVLTGFVGSGAGTVVMCLTGIVTVPGAVTGCLTVPIVSVASHIN